MLNRIRFSRPNFVPALVSTGLAAFAGALFAADALPENVGANGTPSLFPIAANEPADAASSPDAAAAPAEQPVPPAPHMMPSQNVTINLINRLVQRGVLTKEDASDLIKQAEQDAADAKAQATAAERAQAEVLQAAAAQVAAAQPPPPPSDDTVRVTYIPEVVKAQMRDEIKADVMKEARDENWAAPHTMPDWVPRFRVAGDVRVRYEGLFYPSGNDNTGAFPNFNAINTGAPFDVTGTQFSPQYNVDQNRERFRLRARIGAEVDLGDNFTSGIRIATGENNSPTSTNQSMGLANQAQGGNFSKYAIWLDRAFLRYELGGKTDKNLAISVGRFDNPFFSPTEIVWDNDVGFDGAALQAKYAIAKGFTPFIAGGAFPVFNTDLNFSSNQPAKFSSYDKYLYGGQLGFNWAITKDLTAKVAAAYYYFQNIEGRLSNPYTPLTSSDASNTDNSRPSFAQKGNTYMAIRNIVPDASNNFGTTNQWQYFGLATKFRDLVINGQIDYNRFEPVRISLIGEFVKNLAFDATAINAIAVNNRGTVNGTGVNGPFVGGDTGWTIYLKAGTPVFEKFGDWSLQAGYRYVESDAVVDGFCDSEFGGGGTNLKGYVVGGSLALSKRVWLDVLWMSADSIAGPPYQNDILQVDINGKF